MSRVLRAWTLALGLTVFCAISAPAAQALPSGFWGVVPQSGLSAEQFQRLGRGGVESVRIPIGWASVQPTEGSEFDWRGFDNQIEEAAKAGIKVLPFLSGAPEWAVPGRFVSGTHRTLKAPANLPVSGAARTGWVSFLTAAVARYGPTGSFWSEHPGVPKRPIREWQIWNEPNFFYFAYPVSPARYARLVIISSRALKAAQPRAKVLLAGLFGQPTAGGKRGMPAATFLEQLYRHPGLKTYFDGVSLHPYAVDTETLIELIEELHAVTVANHDRVGLYVTEIGWGSQNDFNQVAFEQGVQGQVRQLRGAYEFLISNQRRLNLKQVDWFSWKDLQGSCSFCDSVGLFRAGTHFKPKPSWSAFVALTGGRLRP